MKLTFFWSLLLLSILTLSNLNYSWLILQAMVVIALMNFISPWNHLLLNLLNLELISLLVILSFSLTPFEGINPEFYFSFFTLAVCEASLGIAILIFFSHSKGNEALSSLMALF